MGTIPSGLSKTVGKTNSTSVDEDQLTALISAIRSQKSRLTASSVAPSGPQTTQRSPHPEASAIVQLSANQVWTTPNGMLTGSTIDSFPNWVKFYLSESNNVDNALADAAFYYYLKNPSPDYVTVLSPATTSITVSGTVLAQANQSPIYHYNNASYDVKAYFRVYSPASAPDGISYLEADYEVGSKEAEGGIFTDDNKKLNCDVSGQSLSLPANIEVAPDAYALFEVILQVQYSIDNTSDIVLDFSSVGDYGFGCTGVAFDILTNNHGVAGAEPTSAKGTATRG